MSEYKYYPSPKKTGPLHDDFRLLFDHVYRQQDQIAELHGKMKDDPKHGGGREPSAPGGPSSTKLTGLYVKGTPPVHGASPFYNQSSGQFEYQTAAGAVAPPAHANSPGTPGQIAFDGTHVYVCVGNNSWMRATLSGGF